MYLNENERAASVWGIQWTRVHRAFVKKTPSSVYTHGDISVCSHTELDIFQSTKQVGISD